VKPVVRRVYDGFLDLLSLKFLVEKEASPYTWRFVETWVGVSRKAASSAMRWLISAGFIRFVNYFGSEEAGNGVQLFLMGTRRLVRRLSGRVMLSRGGQTEIINDVQVAVEALEREYEQEEEGKRALKLCKGCGEVTEWVQFDDLVICLNCWQTIDTC
jgi:hypothetical protein